MGESGRIHCFLGIKSVCRRVALCLAHGWTDGKLCSNAIFHDYRSNRFIKDGDDFGKSLLGSDTGRIFLWKKQDYFERVVAIE